MRISVVFPLPDAPHIAKIPLSGISALMLSSTETPSNDFEMF
jgi:hypothetical protein